MNFISKRILSILLVVVMCLTTLPSTAFAADATVTATFTETAEPDLATVYFINSHKWDEVLVYVWGADGNFMPWPGTPMTKTDQTVNGFDIYELTCDASYEYLVFNNNDNGSQTADLAFMDGQYYDSKAGVWYASLDEVPVVDALATDRFLVGTFNGWSTVANEFKLDAVGSATGYVSLELEANTEYEFKIVREGAWTSTKTPITGTVEGLVFSSSVSNNATITTTAAGTYEFAFGLNDSKLSVTYPVVSEPEPDPVTTYTVTVNQAANGTVEADKTTAAENDTVTLIVNPAEGYLLDTLTVGSEDVTAQVVDNTYTFTMPAEDVTVTATFKAATTSEIISVNITWGAMSFTYTDGEWDPETHTYADGEWTPDDDGDNVITVTNNGNVTVNVTFTYTKTVAEVEGSFTDESGNAITSPFALAVKEEKKIKLILNGKPSSTLEDKELGSVTVSITLPEE